MWLVKADVATHPAFEFEFSNNKPKKLLPFWFWFVCRHLITEKRRLFVLCSHASHQKLMASPRGKHHPFLINRPDGFYPFNAIIINYNEVAAAAVVVAPVNRFFQHLMSLNFHRLFSESDVLTNATVRLSKRKKRATPRTWSIQPCALPAVSDFKNAQPHCWVNFVNEPRKSVRQQLL